MQLKLTSYLANLVESSRSISSLFKGLSMVARAKQRRVSRPKYKIIANQRRVSQRKYLDTSKSTKSVVT